MNLYDLLNENKDLFLKFGGHKAAAGFSLKEENLDILKSRLNEQLKQVPANLRTVQLITDLEISIDEVDGKLVKEIELLEPFGSLNPKPIFKINNITLSKVTWMKEVHLKWFFTSKNNPAHAVQGVSFNYANKWNVIDPDEVLSRCQKGESLSVIGTLGINRFRGNEYIQLLVDQVLF